MKSLTFKTLFLVFASLLAISAEAQDISGQWNGILKVQGIQLRIVFNISQTDTGYTATMESPDQSSRAIPVTHTSFENKILKMQIAAAGIEYTGMLQEDSIAGIFKQNGQTFPINLFQKTVRKDIVKRPQEPMRPYPYYSEDVKFENVKDHVKLAGTLTLPKMEGVFPVVVMITGSGAQNRDEEIAGHKPFLVIADYLTRNGIGVLRLDDRGVGGSTGSFQNATTQNFATDIEAAVIFLMSRKEVDKKKIGLIGHSEGGIIAPIVAAKMKRIRFIVLLAGTGIPGGDLLLLQKAAIQKAAGISDASIQKDSILGKGAFEIVDKTSDPVQLKEKLTAYYQKKLKESPDAKPEGMSTEDYITASVNMLSNTWMHYFIRYNPAPVLKDVKCPVLALNGSKDLQVPAKVNLEAIRKGLEKGGNKHVTIHELPGLNHLFQECSTGSPSEYAQIEQTISPSVLKEIADWISIQVK
jgi:pimeloyl-ACP methyl ester carboxylesterase